VSFWLVDNPLIKLSRGRPLDQAQESTMSWLHFSVIAGVALPTLFIAVKMFY